MSGALRIFGCVSKYALFDRHHMSFFAEGWTKSFDLRSFLQNLINLRDIQPYICFPKHNTLSYQEPVHQARRLETIKIITRGEHFFYNNEE